MNRPTTEDHVLPRPVDRLQNYALSTARRNLAEKLVSAFSYSDAAAKAVADAVVDPAITRRNLGDVTDPQVEVIPVPGGDLVGIRTHVWSRRVMPDPRNPRIGPTRRHPIAVDPGTGTEDSRYRPVPEPRSPGSSVDDPELVVEVESTDHLAWASALAAKYVLEENDWRDSIRSQGVMEAVWLVATKYEHADGTSPVTVLTSAEGSSRLSAVHDILGVRSANVPYEDYESKLRAHYKKLNDAFERGATAEQAEMLRCERVPALILVGFRRHSDVVTSGFPTAVKSLVALRHVDPPKPWGAGPENEALADEVLDEMFRRNLITDFQRAYFAGTCTRSEARAAHLSDDPAVRAAAIVRLFLTKGGPVDDAIRVAVTSQSTRKRIRDELRDDLAIALILRSLPSEPASVDRARRYLRKGYGRAIHSETWDSTNRDTDELVAEALLEVNRSMATGATSDPGPASLELAARAAFPLVARDQLAGDRGNMNNMQPDRRTPGEVLDAMRRKPQGVFQLGQALRDFRDNKSVRAVDASGNLVSRPDGTGHVLVDDIYLRSEFPPHDRVAPKTPGRTPTELLNNALNDFSEAVERLDVAFAAVDAVKGNNGCSQVEVEGVDSRFCEQWRASLERVREELSWWGRRFRQRHASYEQPEGDTASPYGDDADNVSDPHGTDGWPDPDEDGIETVVNEEAILAGA